MTKREKILAWIKTELVDKKRRKPRPPKGLSVISNDGWGNGVFERGSKACVMSLSKAEKKFAIEAVRACGFTPKWTE